MSAISNFAKSGMWDYQKVIAPTAVAIPLAIEGVLLVKNFIQNPGYLKEKVVEAKHTFIDSFTRRNGEPTQDAVKRIVKNVFIALSCLALMGAAAYLSIHLLPAAMGISTAISAIILIGKLFVNASTYKNKIIEAFTAKPGEDPAIAKMRIRKSILKTVAATIILGATIAIGAHILIPLLHKFSWSVSLPFQTKAVVFCEYAALGLIHAGIAYSKYKKGDKAGAAFHLAATVAAFTFPFFYLNHEMRLHHSFYGLALMALPSRPSKILGSMITLDSAMYMLAPIRGGINARGRFSSFDFINIIVNNFALFFNGMTAATITENINDNWAKETARKKKFEKLGLVSAPANFVKIDIKS